MIVLVIGTNRPDSTTAKIASQVTSIYNNLNVKVEVVDLAKLPIEIFNSTSYAEKPLSFQLFSDTIIHADGIHWITPEYNGSLPGVAKYFIDMLKFPETFVNCPIALTGLAAGIWGALRPVEQLQDIVLYRQGIIYPEKVFMSNVFKLINSEGKLTDESIIKRLESQAKGFVAFVEKQKGIKL